MGRYSSAKGVVEKVAPACMARFLLVVRREKKETRRAVGWQVFGWHTQPVVLEKGMPAAVSHI